MLKEIVIRWSEPGACLASPSAWVVRRRSLRMANLPLLYELQTQLPPLARSYSDLSFE